MSRVSRHFQFTKRVWMSFLEYGGLEARSLQKLALRDAAYGRVTCELEIEKMHTNRFGTLHGGTIATLVDLVGSLAIASRGYFSTGVSTDLNCTYVRSGGVVGQRIHVEAICDNAGRSLAYTDVTFRDDTRRLFARGSHTKFLGKAASHPQNNLEELKAQS